MKGKIVFVCEGGIGKNIIGTAVVRALKNSGAEEIVVVASHPDVWLNNPNVTKLVPMSAPFNLFDDYLKGGRYELVRHEPYTHPDFVSGSRHMADVWCEQIGIPCDGIKPDLFLTKSETDWAAAFRKQVNRPLLIVQANGGIMPRTNSAEDVLAAKSAMWKRSLPNETVQALVMQLKDRYAVLSMGGPNQFVPQFALSPSLPIRNWFALASVADKFVLIDSVLQHACAALGKKAVVCWGGTSPVTAGYDLHTNLNKARCPQPNCQRPYSHLFDILPNGQPWSCPFGERCMQWELNEIIEAIGMG